MGHTSYLTVTDQFCGAGGSSQGAVDAGAEVRMALNHWKLAIETHNSNFPQTDHDCTDISACDPRRYPTTDILITSPECQNHSLAKGIKRPTSQQSFFDGKGPDPAAERSRATLWDVPRFAEYHNYRIIIVENVPDVRHWIMWDAWIMAMNLLGYDYKCVYFNSMFAWPTPQSRDRVYVVFWKKGNRAPDLDFYPPAWCTTCGTNVESVQSWKNPARAWGKYKQQYVYRCPACATRVEPYYYAAWNAIDWSIPAPRIGDRKRPLKDKTLARIRYGLDKFSRQPNPFLAGMSHSHDAHDRRSYGLDEPMVTQTARPSVGLVQPPLLVKVTHSQAGAAEHTREVTRPFPTQTARQDMGVCVPPFLAELRNNKTINEVTEPLSTVCAGGGHHGLVTPPAWIVANYSPGYVKPVSEPTGSITTVDHHALLTAPQLFVTSYYSEDQGHAISDPLGTISTRDRHGLVTPPFMVSYYGERHGTHGLEEPVPTVPTMALHYLAQPGEIPDIDDCGFRMLQPHEIGAAMAFARSYVVLGNQREKIKQYGNAVTPPVMKLIVARCVASLS